MQESPPSTMSEFLMLCRNSNITIATIDHRPQKVILHGIRRIERKRRAVFRDIETIPCFSNSFWIFFNSARTSLLTRNCIGIGLFDNLNADRCNAIDAVDLRVIFLSILDFCNIRKVNIAALT